MRMTNEEFQAEVFRRAGTYQQKRSRRVRFMTGAVGFACCLIVAVAALPRLTNGMRSDEVWENAREDIMADEAQGYCDSSEAAANAFTL